MQDWCLSTQILYSNVAKRAAVRLDHAGGPGTKPPAGFAGGSLEVVTGWLACDEELDGDDFRRLPSPRRAGLRLAAWLLGGIPSGHAQEQGCQNQDDPVPPNHLSDL
jgi:hypothetical protein